LQRSRLSQSDLVPWHKWTWARGKCLLPHVVALQPFRQVPEMYEEPLSLWAPGSRGWFVLVRVGGEMSSWRSEKALSEQLEEAEVERLRRRFGQQSKSCSSGLAAGQPGGRPGIAFWHTPRRARRFVAVLGMHAGSRG
jgi:hypothetical protein